LAKATHLHRGDDDGGDGVVDKGKVGNPSALVAAQYKLNYCNHNLLVLKFSLHYSDKPKQNHYCMVCLHT
jgi:hypothetical protein